MRTKIKRGDALVLVLFLCLVIAFILTGCGRSVFNEGSAAPAAPTGPELAAGGSPLNAPEGLTLLQLPRPKHEDHLLKLTRADKLDDLSEPPGLSEWRDTNVALVAPDASAIAGSPSQLTGPQKFWLNYHRTNALAHRAP